MPPRLLYTRVDANVHTHWLLIGGPAVLTRRLLLGLMHVPDVYSRVNTILSLRGLRVRVSAVRRCLPLFLGAMHLPCSHWAAPQQAK